MKYTILLTWYLAKRNANVIFYFHRRLLVSVVWFRCTHDTILTPSDVVFNNIFLHVSKQHNSFFCNFPISKYSKNFSFYL